MKKIYFFFLLFIHAVIGNSQNCFLPTPVPQTSGATACTIPLYWQSIAGADHYEVKYKVSGTNTWLDTINTGINTTVVITGLMAEKNTSLR